MMRLDMLVIVYDIISSCSIKKAVHKIFLHARHGVCAYQIKQNLNTKFKNPTIHKLFLD